jgi:hypothetical protein
MKKGFLINSKAKAKSAKDRDSNPIAGMQERIPKSDDPNPGVDPQLVQDLILRLLRYCMASWKIQVSDMWASREVRRPYPCP